MSEPRGCPTPGACSCPETRLAGGVTLDTVAEGREAWLALIKERLLMPDGFVPLHYAGAILRDFTALEAEVSRLAARVRELEAERDEAREIGAVRTERLCEATSSFVAAKASLAALRERALAIVNNRIDDSGVLFVPVRCDALRVDLQRIRAIIESFGNPEELERAADPAAGVDDSPAPAQDMTAVVSAIEAQFPEHSWSVRVEPTPNGIIRATARIWDRDISWQGYGTTPAAALRAAYAKAVASLKGGSDD